MDKTTLQGAGTGLALGLVGTAAVAAIAALTPLPSYARAMLGSFIGMDAADTVIGGLGLVAASLPIAGALAGGYFSGGSGDRPQPEPQTTPAGQGDPRQDAETSRQLQAYFQYRQLQQFRNPVRSGGKRSR